MPSTLNKKRFVNRTAAKPPFFILHACNECNWRIKLFRALFVKKRRAEANGLCFTFNYPLLGADTPRQMAGRDYQRFESPSDQLSDRYLQFR